MSSSTADPLFKAIRQDWPAAAPSAVRKPVLPSPFESLLTPREPLPNPLAQEPPSGSHLESTAAANSEEIGSKATNNQATAQPRDSETGTEEASEELQQTAVEDTTQTDLPGEDELPSALVQSLSGSAGIAVPVDTTTVTSAESPVPPASDAADGILTADAADSGANIDSPGPHSPLADADSREPTLAEQVGGATPGFADSEHQHGDKLLAGMIPVRVGPSPAETDSAFSADSDQRQVESREHGSDASHVLLATGTGADSKPSDLGSDTVNQPFEAKGSTNSSPALPINGTAAVDALRIPLPAEIMAPAGATDHPRAGTEIDSARLLHRVARAFAQAADHSGEVTIRLSPPELGALRLEVQVRDGVLAAHLQTETPEARTAILENLPALRERLAEQGVRIERFDVDLMNRQSGGSPQQAFSDQRESPRTWRHANEANSATKPPTTVPNVSKTIATGPGRLNVIV